MKDQFLPHEHSKMLKELGFDEECMVFHHDNLLFSFGEDDGDLMFKLRKQSECGEEDTVCAPLWQQIELWLWEKHEIHIKHEMVGDCFEYYARTKSHQLIKYSDRKEFNSPIIAKQEGIKAIIELLYEQIKK